MNNISVPYTQTLHNACVILSSGYRHSKNTTIKNRHASAKIADTSISGIGILSIMGTRVVTYMSYQ